MVKTISVIAFRIAVTLDVKIGWLGRQVAVCVNKRHKWSSSYKIDIVIGIKTFLNPEGHHNPICSLNVTAILRKG